VRRSEHFRWRSVRTTGNSPSEDPRRRDHTASLSVRLRQAGFTQVESPAKLAWSPGPSRISLTRTEIAPAFTRSHDASRRVVRGTDRDSLVAVRFT
jgi:hypothetical protein